MPVRVRLMEGLGLTARLTNFDSGARPSLVLRQVVSDLEPRSLGANKEVPLELIAGRLIQTAKWNANPAWVVVVGANEV